MADKKIPPFVEYHNGYTHQNLPPLKRVEEYLSTKRFSGVRSCNHSDRADNAAKEELRKFIDKSTRYNPNLVVVRAGWVEGRHYWNNNGGGFGTSGRSCKGHVSTTFYVDFAKGREE